MLALRECQYVLMLARSFPCRACNVLLLPGLTLPLQGFYVADHSWLLLDCLRCALTTCDIGNKEAYVATFKSAFPALSAQVIYGC
jgi:hypothetical protein